MQFHHALIPSLAQDVGSGKMASEDLEAVITAASRAQSKVTLNELLDTLKLLEEEPELLPQPKTRKEDKYAWIDGVINISGIRQGTISHDYLLSLTFSE